MLFPIDDYHCCVLNSLCVCDYVCWCVSTCVLKVPHQCDCLARVYQWHHPIVFIQKETTISIVLLITKLWMKHACGAARCCVCVITLWWYFFFVCRSSSMSNQKTRELYRGFQENANAWLCHCTLVSPILRVLLVLSWAIVNFHFFRFSERESMSAGEERERERREGYYILRKSSNYGSLLFLFRSFTRHLQSDEGGVNGLCLFFS